jgi:hypothetical protein
MEVPRSEWRLQVFASGCRWCDRRADAVHVDPSCLLVVLCHGNHSRIRRYALSSIYSRRVASVDTYISLQCVSFVSTDYYPTSVAGKWVATFAMLSGVLVIAFPVSVFSDLWQKELRQYSGFEELDDDVGQVNAALDGKDAEQSAEERAKWTAQAESLPDRVVIEKKDLKEIMECMQTMRESDQRMRAILHNYYQV